MTIPSDFVTGKLLQQSLLKQDLYFVYNCDTPLC